VLYVAAGLLGLMVRTSPVPTVRARTIVAVPR
jgi:hypothetical protein